MPYEIPVIILKQTFKMKSKLFISQLKMMISVSLRI